MLFNIFFIIAFAELWLESSEDIWILNIWNQLVNLGLGCDKTITMIADGLNAISKTNKL